ncbi:hypothetical protein GCM10027027_00160 [Neomicrococcus lactis]
MASEAEDDDAAVLAADEAVEADVEDADEFPFELQPVTASATANGTARKSFLFMIPPKRR